MATCAALAPTAMLFLVTSAAPLSLAGRSTLRTSNADNLGPAGVESEVFTTPCRWCRGVSKSTTYAPLDDCQPIFAPGFLFLNSGLRPPRRVIRRTFTALLQGLLPVSLLYSQLFITVSSPNGPPLRLDGSSHPATRDTKTVTDLCFPALRGYARMAATCSNIFSTIVGEVSQRNVKTSSGDIGNTASLAVESRDRC
ncbi:hypothetical protein BCR34DRAFT_591038 [Clohesyomyces aquaticus]|uniref:Secreted protein n=1 Tax=Clohesyomyces aquaticus TaxID=1231657 RepID=A0A1Y1Z3U5_9PLEO|nr:hypothetical protein BCR34DRAFT_591038 [Clohesyomyces aquaticus]